MLLVIMLQFLFLRLSIFGSMSSCVDGKGNLSPILIIPGSGNSLDVTDSSDTSCNTNGQTLRLWLNETLVATAPECYTNQSKFEYSPSQGYADPPGVTVTAPGFGNISSIDFVGPYPFYYNLTEYFVQRGYVRNLNIRAAPYDWRLNPEMLTERGYFVALRDLIEQMYEENDNVKITLLVDSQGGPVSLYFLNNIVTQEWKDTYIDTYIPLSSAFAAGSHILHIILSGPVILTDTIVDTQIDRRELDRTLPAIFWLLPHASVWKDTVLVVTPTRNYTANDYEALFNDAGYPQGYAQFMESEKYLEVPRAPNVTTHCIYGLGFPTPLSFVYDEGFPDKRPIVVYGDGDSVVNVQSLETCLQWANSAYSFNSTVFHGIASHSSAVVDKEVLQLIGSIVGAPRDPIDVCQLPAQPGSCDDDIPRYFFNSENGLCEQFSYGGCDGNGNNFETLEECNSRCNPNGCPPLCTQGYCSAFATRRALCTLPTPQGICEAKCRITYCHTCYYDDDYRPLPDRCTTCPYYPQLRQARNWCFRRWAVCTRRANADLYKKSRGKKEKTAERFKCNEHPCS